MNNKLILAFVFIMAVISIGAAIQTQRYTKQIQVYQQEIQEDMRLVDRYTACSCLLLADEKYGDPLQYILKDCDVVLKTVVNPNCEELP